jgi:hypothetical protein
MASTGMIARSIVRANMPAKRLLHSSRPANIANKESGATARSNEAGPSSERLPPSRTSNTGSPPPPPETQAVDGKPSFTTSASAVNAELDKKPIPYLSAPLGVRARPSSRKLTWTERKDQALDYDRRMETRKAMWVPDRGFSTIHFDHVMTPFLPLTASKKPPEGTLATFTQ